LEGQNRSNALECNVRRIEQMPQKKMYGQKVWIDSSRLWREVFALKRRDRTYLQNVIDNTRCPNCNKYRLSILNRAKNGYSVLCLFCGKFFADVYLGNIDSFTRAWTGYANCPFRPACTVSAQLSPLRIDSCNPG
jgi:hypothetical protein